MLFDWGIVITGLIGGVVSIITGWTSWFFARLKYNAEVDGAKIDNLKLIIDILNEQIKNLSERLDIVLERNKQLEAEVVEVRRLMFNVLSSICFDFTCKHRVSEEGKRKEKPNMIPVIEK